MKLKEAVQHLDEILSEDKWSDCDECKKEHIQLRKWLVELQERRKKGMRKIDWVKKLTSRKLWLSIASFVSLLVVALGYTENQAAQVAALIMAGATVIGYTIGEGLTDAANKGSYGYIWEEDDEEVDDNE